MIKVEFIDGPLDGKGEVHPLANAFCIKVEGYPEGYYTVNPYDPSLKYYWITIKSAAKYATRRSHETEEK